MTNSRQVEVVCDFCDGNGVGLFTGDPCRECLGQTVERKRVAPSSLAAAMLTLAEAVMRKTEAERKVLNEFCIDEYEEAILRRQEYKAALAAVRNHPDYRRPE